LQSADLVHVGRGALRVGSGCGIMLSTSNLRPFHDELDEVERISLFSLLLLVPIDLVRCGLSPSLVGCLLVLDSISSIPGVAMASGSKESQSRVFFPIFWFSRVQALVCLYPIDHHVSFVLVATTAPLRTRGMS
jgi:hypothetical protein